MVGVRQRTVGVLALQGAFSEHVWMLNQLGADAREVRLPADLAQIDSLIIPGGESTTFGILAERFGLIAPLQAFAQTGKPVWGTCAGMIFLAKNVGRPQPTLGLLDISVQRNAFGRQTESFTRPLDVTGLGGEPFLGVFIRAPIAQSAGPGVEVLCALAPNQLVALRNGNLLATAFHPELTRDTRMHKLFLDMAV